MRILLGITGGIAAYKAPELVRALRKDGHAVRCLLTEAGARLVAADALAAVSGERVWTTLWSTVGDIPHIDLARWAEVLLVAPLTADAAARLALGFADDLLTTTVLALEPEKPLWLAPAMNTVMWNKPVVQQHLRTLAERGARIIPPVSGHLACGEQGVGAMAEPMAITAAIRA
jgi:phosphopantothenoylcysteine decarboxylase/phosphopantothenate--cysteine ligase